MVIIRNVDSYKDGGTISLNVVINFKGFQYTGEVCLDKRIGINDGGFWMGYPGKDGSSKIIDKELLEHIKKSVMDFKKYQNYKLDEVIENL